MAAEAEWLAVYKFLALALCAFAAAIDSADSSNIPLQNNPTTKRGNQWKGDVQAKR